MLELLKSRQSLTMMSICVVMSAVLIVALGGGVLAFGYVLALLTTFAMFWATLHMDKVRR